MAGQSLRVPALDPVRFAADVPRRARSRCADTIEDDLFDGSAGAVLDPVVGALAYAASLLRPRLARRPPALRRSTACSCCSSRSRASCSRSRWRSGSLGPDRGRARHGGRAVRVAGRRPVRIRARAASMRGRRPAREAQVPMRHGGTGACRGRGGGRRPDDAPRSRVRRCGVRDHARRADAAQRGRADRQGPGASAGRLRVQRAADRPRAAAALPGGPDLAAPPPRRAGGDAGGDEFDRAIRITVLAIAASRAQSRSPCSPIGPWAMDVFGGKATTTVAAASRCSRSAWASISSPARSTRPRSPAAAPASPPARGLAPRRSSPGWPRRRRRRGPARRGRLLRRGGAARRAVLGLTGGPRPSAG